MMRWYTKPQIIRSDTAQWAANQRPRKNADAGVPTIVENVRVSAAYFGFARLGRMASGLHQHITYELHIAVYWSKYADPI